MEIRTVLIGIGVLILISLLSLIFILSNIDPYGTTIWSFVLFYLSFFIAAAGLFTLTGFYLRKLAIKNKIAIRLFKTSFRQGILLSIILINFLILQSFGVLAWWNGGVVVLIMLAIEIYFGKYKK